MWPSPSLPRFRVLEVTAPIGARRNRSVTIAKDGEDRYPTASVLEIPALASAALLLAVAYLVFWRIFEVLPLDGDNLYILSWADRAPASTLIHTDPAIAPEWRPLAFLTVWLQYRWSGADPTVYLAVNLFLWTACAWLVYRIVDRLVGSRPAGLLAAVLVLTDNRSITALTWIVERQSSLACLFGLLALLWVFERRDRRFTPLEGAGLLTLLLAAGLSKEYGLAFAAGLAAHALGTRRADVGGAAFGAMAVYAGLRLAFAPVAVEPYCMNVGYFRITRWVCYDRLDVAVPQMLYNVVATGVGSLLNGAFSAAGQIRITADRLVASAILLPIAVLGWVKGPRPEVRVTALIVVFNALLSVMLYRSRNQLIAACATAIAAAVGWAILDGALKLHARPSARVAIAALLIALLAVQMVRTQREASGAVQNLLARDPCIAPDRRVAPDFVRRIKMTYGMTNPDCSHP